MSYRIFLRKHIWQILSMFLFIPFSFALNIKTAILFDWNIYDTTGECVYSAGFHQNSNNEIIGSIWSNSNANDSFDPDENLICVLSLSMENQAEEKFHIKYPNFGEFTFSMENDSIISGNIESIGDYIIEFSDSESGKIFINLSNGNQIELNFNKGLTYSFPLLKQYLPYLLAFSGGIIIVRLFINVSSNSQIPREMAAKQKQRMEKRAKILKEGEKLRKEEKNYYEENISPKNEGKNVEREENTNDENDKKKNEKHEKTD
ncbi:hypothetical protein TRFO_12016 [Tritrichomonas foetus]|uniref:Uncharacterized protein n=1 Tax=Tritrichomonas foetus TaxID=1144522 RepID=A0A1J4J0Y8_9EUKA|nr:hypothetical protein TRFO_12016 [Tritrichomonas foetus]|eukprot:OHS93192.1 hypothetical protein TRFO_12016 [Tritrichomonas foetus]